MLGTGALAAFLKSVLRTPSGAIDATKVSPDALGALQRVIKADKKLVVRGTTIDSAEKSLGQSSWATRDVPVAYQFARGTPHLIENPPQPALHVLQLPQYASKYPKINMESEALGPYFGEDPINFYDDFLMAGPEFIKNRILKHSDYMTKNELAKARNAVAKIQNTPNNILQFIGREELAGENATSTAAQWGIPSIDVPKYLARKKGGLAKWPPR